jgi:predicted acetyltransferase
MHFQKQKLFINATVAMENFHFNYWWGKTRMELVHLVCNPSYQSRGAVISLTEWGLQRAKEQGLPIMLTASPLGRLVFQHLGFRDLDYLECGVEGQKEKVNTWILIWTPEGWKEPDR